MRRGGRQRPALIVQNELDSSAVGTVTAKTGSEAGNGKGWQWGLQRIARMLDKVPLVASAADPPAARCPCTCCERYATLPAPAELGRGPSSACGDDIGPEERLEALVRIC